ncbi:sugar/nucleoside kinase (ribokinase family) [Methylobacterium sp. RAS18]|nr:sugar/nucleoside kinase (ribokinase family) [Methylobacterium sp. RAS18]
MVPFRPVDRSTALLAATTASGANRIALKRAGGEAQHVRLHNPGPSMLFVRFGDSTVTATTADLPLPVGAVEVLDTTGATHVDAVTASGSSLLYATCGKGL